jgi:hypothetical protein
MSERIYTEHLADARFHLGHARRALTQAQELAPTEAHHDKLGQAADLLARIAGLVKHHGHSAERIQRRRAT